MSNDPPLLDVRGVTRRYRLRRGLFARPGSLTAVDDVSLTVKRGRSLGVVGESGSGKSTLARLIMALERPDAGSVLLKGEDLNQLAPDRLRQMRRHLQMVFQDPRGSLDPRMTVERIIAEPLDVAEPKLGTERRERIRQALAAVGLEADALGRYPHEFSGGQRQRIAIARALITAPSLVVADEPVSALDVSVQAQVLNLMMDLQDDRGLTYVLISHDLAVVEHIADDVIVMYRGRVVESGPAEDLFRAPAHPYTRALVDAVSDLDRDPAAVTPVVPIREAPPTRTGCAYSRICGHADRLCREEVPELATIGPGRQVACFRPLT